MSFDNVEDLFKQLDEKEFSFFSGALGVYMKSLMKEGFTRREAFRLVESYSKFIYDMSIEQFMVEKRLEEEAQLLRDYPEDEDDVDSEDDPLL